MAERREAKCARASCAITSAAHEIVVQRSAGCASVTPLPLSFAPTTNPSTTPPPHPVSFLSLVSSLRFLHFFWPLVASYLFILVFFLSRRFQTPESPPWLVCVGGTDRTNSASCVTKEQKLTPWYEAGNGELYFLGFYQRLPALCAGNLQGGFFGPFFGLTICCEGIQRDGMKPGRRWNCGRTFENGAIARGFTVALCFRRFWLRDLPGCAKVYV